MYHQSSIPGIGRTTWPFHPSPRMNPLIVQNGFRFIERMITENIEEETEDAGL